MNSSPKIITSLGFNEIFVFGSNESGRHGAGAAKQALKWGAIYGKGVGPYGRTYAIPTRKFVRGSQQTIGVPYFDGVYSIVTLSLPEIHTYIINFITYASIHKELDFLVTSIGCSNAGYKPRDIAPSFFTAWQLKNVYLPESFIEVLNDLVNR